MSETTDKEMLEEVNKAIRTIMAGGQSYTIAGRSLTRADLKQLREMKAEYESAISAQNSALMDNTVCAVFEGR